MANSNPSYVGTSKALEPVSEELLALAPRHLQNLRRTRFIGDDLCVTLAQLAWRDQELLNKFYKALTELLSNLTDTSTDDAWKWREIMVWLQIYQLVDLIPELQQLGQASYAEGSSETLAKAMHDIRGGALSALLGRLQLIQYRPHTSGELKVLFVLTRDHLKIMRNAVVGLDERRREADRTPKGHAMSLIMDKWHETTVGPKWLERPIQMAVDCRYEGTLTECCLESAAIDRIFYNLANNACRHALGNRIDMAIFPVPEPPGNCLRFVLSNEVNAKDASYLSAMTLLSEWKGAERGTGQNLFALFEPAISSTGSGFGLTVVADFVADAFGLRDRAEALSARYVGAILDGHTFRAWFHWPMANGGLPAKLDDYHQPDQSLSA